MIVSANIFWNRWVHQNFIFFKVNTVVGYFLVIRECNVSTLNFASKVFCTLY